MMQNIIKHTLKGKNGWSILNLSVIDVAKIKSIDFRKRVFCIFDKDLPYTLDIKYYEPKQHTSIAPTFTGRGVGFTVVTETKVYQNITKRYSTQEECMKEVHDIHEKQYYLTIYAEELAEKIMKNSY